MRTCVLYISRTGNTQRLAEAISDLLKAPVFDARKSEPTIIENFDLLIFGAPVTGLQPAPELMSFVERLPKSEGKKTILFCTYLFAKGRTFKILEKALAKKGCSTILCVSKKGVNPSKADFSDVLDEIARTVEAQPP
jgi:flavodoxin